jgi:hypothetical protein
MSSDAALIGWSALGLIWWLVAWRLAGVAPADSAKEEISDDRRLTIFKPLPPLSRRHFHESRGLETFIGQIDERSELLLGAHEEDRSLVEPFVARMRAEHPRASIRVVWRDEPDSLPNPKVAWLKVLAPHATGELWLWSDADIAAPPGFLRAARAEIAVKGTRMVTWPYVIRDLGNTPALLDGLFVNAEFFPGVLLLRRLGPVDFGLGAAMLFSRADFESCVGWYEIGEALADDFIMGRKLRPVRIGRAVLTTDAEAETWRAAILHYLRWSKTVRWNRPLGTAARIIVLPVLGWIAMIACHPASLSGWLGLGAIMQMDVLFAMLICRHVGCPLRLRHVGLLELWSVGRGLVWLVCWMPWPVIWRGRAWSGPFSQSERGDKPVPIRENSYPEGVDKT